MQGLQDRLGDPAGGGGIGKSGHDDRKLVAAQPRHHLIVVENARDALCDGLQRSVARRVPEQVVDLLEPVEVEAQNGEPPPGVQRRFDLLIELLVEAGAIGKPGEGVMVGKKENVPFRFLARTKIANRDGAMRLAAEINDALDELDRHFRAVAMTQDALDERVLALEQLETQVRRRENIAQASCRPRCRRSSSR